MLWTIVAVLPILWLLGFNLHVAGGLNSRAAIVVVATVVINLVSGRKGAAGHFR